jgi:hypothetical protein
VRNVCSLRVLSDGEEAKTAESVAQGESRVQEAIQPAQLTHQIGRTLTAALLPIFPLQLRRINSILSSHIFPESYTT